MHLYIVVRLRQPDAGGWEASAPDVPAVRIAAPTSGEALARVRLALEGAIAERLGRGGALPEVRSLQELAANAEPGSRYFEVHMNLRHLAALARHQQGRWPD